MRRSPPAAPLRGKPDDRFMLSSWTRPSSILLAAVVAANVALPVVHYAAGEGSTTGRGGASEPAVVAPPARSLPAPVESAPQVAASVRPVEVPFVAKRVTHRQAPRVCRAWGPFTEVARAESVAAELELDPVDFEVFESEVRTRPDYLVTVQVPGSRRAGNRVMNELRNQDVDSYRLDRPGNVLAAGVFGNRERAETQRRKIAELGYDVVVEPLDRSHRVYHLMARLPADLPAESVPEVPPAGTCSDIAPMRQFL